ncbi:MAG: response regulator, partial [Anaerolineae bacterium]
HGIPRGVQSRIFDPYFTTKGGGSGLGLAVVYSVIVKHEGYVTVDSEMDRGSRFHFYLPVAVTPGPGRPSAGRRLRVLVMDDETIVLRVAQRMLDRLGCQTVVAAGGAEAVELFRKARDSGLAFDAVILDLHVPGGMGGTETLARLRQIDPGVRGIVSSGYSSDRVMANYAAHGFVAAMDKPYSMAVLQEAIAAAALA